MKTKKTQTVAAATSRAARRWPHLLNETISTLVDPHLAPPETRACAHDLITALRGYIVRHLGTNDVVLDVEETGDVKKGNHTVGVARQYSSTVGGIENCQVAVHLTYSTPGAHALIDHRFYLPRAWTEAPTRLQAAGVPAGAGFATKPELAKEMIATTLESVPTGWVGGDEVYGRNPDLRAYLEEHRVGYVMAVAATDRLPTPRGRWR